MLSRQQGFEAKLQAFDTKLQGTLDEVNTKLNIVFVVIGTSVLSGIGSLGKGSDNIRKKAENVKEEGSKIK